MLMVVDLNEICNTFEEKLLFFLIFILMFCSYITDYF